MPLIVNLSCLHTLNSIPKTIGAFASLTSRYSEPEGQCSPCSFFHLDTVSNFVWVTHEYWSKYETLISPYKLGDISTEKFLQNLHTIFYFLEASDIAPAASGLKKYHDNPVYNLLAETWNTEIALEDGRVMRFRHIVERATSGEKVYLISNSNELHILAILLLLMEKYEDFPLIKGLDLSNISSKEPLEIADNIFLCVSYRYQLYKTPEGNRTTMCLLRHLVQENLKDVDIRDIEVVSQYQADLTTAASLGITRCEDADSYFASQPGPAHLKMS